MGLLKDLILFAAVKKAEEAIRGKSTEKEPVIENEQKQQKTPLFQSRGEFAGAVLATIFFSQFFYMFALFVLQVESFSWAVFYRSYAMAALVSCALLLIGLMAYGMYLIDFLPALPLLLLFPVIFGIILPYIEFGVSIFTGIWMNSTVKLICCLLGIIAITTSLAYTCYCETEESKTNVQK